MGKWEGDGADVSELVCDESGQEFYLRLTDVACIDCCKLKIEKPEFTHLHIQSSML